MTQLIILTEHQIQLAKEKAELLDLLIQSVEQKSNQAKSDSEGMDEVMYRASDVHLSLENILHTLKFIKL
jgi:hypothetical protein